MAKAGIYMIEEMVENNSSRQKGISTHKHSHGLEAPVLQQGEITLLVLPYCNNGHVHPLQNNFQLEANTNLCKISSEYSSVFSEYSTLQR